MVTEVEVCAAINKVFYQGRGGGGCRKMVRAALRQSRCAHESWAEEGVRTLTPVEAGPEHKHPLLCTTPYMPLGCVRLVQGASKERLPLLGRSRIGLP